MKRHPLNVFSLLFGIVLILAATWTAFAPRGWLFAPSQWHWQLVLPAAAILLGAALMSPLFTTRRADGAPEDGTANEPAGEATDTSADIS